MQWLELSKLMNCELNLSVLCQFVIITRAKTL